MIRSKFGRSFPVVSVVLAVALLKGSSNAVTSDIKDWTNQNWTSLDHDEITANLKLIQIDVSDNNITELNSTMLVDHRYLEVFILSRNKLYDFPPDSSFLSSISLERFECCSCAITTIFNATFSELPKLKELDLSGNELSVIQPAAFSTQFFLQKLNFDFNKLTSLPVNILKQSKVNASISMSHNSDFNFQPYEVLIKSKILKEFRCSYCGISAIYDETFSELPSIESIDLNNNKISTINAKMFDKNRNLISLSIEQNDLNDFPQSVFDAIPMIKSLCIDGNPFIMTAKNAFKSYYARFSLRTNCTEVDGTNYFEYNLNPAEPTKNKGISDAFIASYLLIILVAQAAVIGILVLYYFKIVFTDKDDEFDYSSNVLNDHDVYNVS
ncbi:leucine-rich repeat-containing G-protein coupled receptor 5A-like [Bradysia coprophila]|uniref:leucine-rich repeat-containing G-protein coupled receptor 5A-like n=1 Tax=Bradysia coprophila TaxID=38358 RepID=UPI00187D7EF6|nr:leucine-rich repeat-containing G-protein coupled receptor 5A-like [Bradysia coprophila]